MQNKLFGQRNVTSSLVLLNPHLLGHKKHLGRAEGGFGSVVWHSTEGGSCDSTFASTRPGMALPLYPIMSGVDPWSCFHGNVPVWCLEKWVDKYQIWFTTQLLLFYLCRTPPTIEGFARLKPEWFRGECQPKPKRQQHSCPIQYPTSQWSALWWFHGI